MRIMTIGAAYQLIFNRVSERAVAFGPNILMTVVAVCLFFELVQGRVCAVYGVATGAGDVIVVVQTALPVIDIILVAVEAHLILLCCRNIGIFTKGYQARHIDFSLLIEMFAARAMAGLTTTFF